MMRFCTQATHAVWLIKTLLISTALLPVAWAGTSSPSAVQTPPLPAPTAMLEWLKKHKNPKRNLTFEHRESGWIPGKQLLWSTIDFRGPNSPISVEVGRTLVVWSPNSTEPAWALKQVTDFGIHNVRWADFDGDGELDLLAMAGEEEYYQTELFLWRGKPMPTQPSSPLAFNPKAMVRVYKSENSYATMLDVDNDGVAEILDNGMRGDVASYSLCSQGEDVFNVPKKLEMEAKTQYLKLAGRFAKDNLMYDEESGYSISSLELLSPFRLLRFDRQGKPYEVSLPIDHLQWRTQFLQNISKLNEGRCLKHIQNALKHNQKLLKAVK